VIGFFVAAFSAAGLVFLSRAGRGYFGMRHVFRRLDTSPGQEKVIRNALDEMRGVSSELKQQMRSARPELAELVRRGNVTPHELDAWIKARVAEVNQASPTAVEALSKIHEVLDDRQRSTLANWIERGRGAHGCGHYRHGSHC